MTTPNHVGGIKAGLEVEEVTNNTIHLLIDKIDTLLQSGAKKEG
jgi:hypothetical protein